MALLLDAKLVGEVAQVCPAEFLRYYECLGKGDAQQCLGEQAALSKCVLAKSSSFKKIVSNCKPQMDAYESCIRENTDFRTQCFDLLYEMRQCVAKTIDSGS